MAISLAHVMRADDVVYAHAFSRPPYYISLGMRPPFID